MEFLILSLIIRILFWPVLIIGLIIFFVHRRRKTSHPLTDNNWYLQFALSKEDAVSQFFLLLAFFFLGLTLQGFNHDFGDPVSWRVILFVTSALGLASAYYLKTIYTLIFSLIGLISWWGAEAAVWMDAKTIQSSALFAGLAFLALLFFSLGHLHEKQMKYRRFALIYLILGIMFITASLFLFSTQIGIELLGSMTKGQSFTESWQLSLSLLVFLFALLIVTIYAHLQKLISSFELAAVCLLAALFAIIALLPEQSMYLRSGGIYDFYATARSNNLSSTGLLWAVIFNLLTFFELLGLVFSGYVRGEKWLINFGAVFLFLLIIIKYSDWFFTSLDKSIFFIGAGILMFALGWFMEKGRRYMLATIKTPPTQ